MRSLRSDSASSPLRRGVDAPWLQAGGELSVATAYRCINVLSHSVAKLDVECLRRRGDIFVDNADDPLHYLLNVEPCPWLSAADFKALVMRHLLMRGNAYIVPVYSELTGRCVALVPVHPSKVSHDTIQDLYKVNDTDAGICGTYGEQDIVHLKNFSIDGKHGLSTISYARKTLEIAERGDTETLKRFTTGGNVRGLLTNARLGVKGVGEYQDDELDRLALDIDRRFKSGENIVAVHGQSELTQLSMSSADMQFLESRKFSVLDICRFFGVPPQLVFADTANNYKSAEMNGVSFLSDTLGPLLKMIENELDRKLIGRFGYGRRKLRFDLSGLHATDLEGNDRHRSALLGTGRTVNEIRRIDNLPPVEGGDSVILSANFKTLDMLNNETDHNNANTYSTHASSE